MRFFENTGGAVRLPILLCWWPIAMVGLRGPVSHLKFETARRLSCHGLDVRQPRAVPVETAKMDFAFLFGRIDSTVVIPIGVKLRARVSPVKRGARRYHEAIPVGSLHCVRGRFVFVTVQDNITGGQKAASSLDSVIDATFKSKPLEGVMQNTHDQVAFPEPRKCLLDLWLPDNQLPVIVAVGVGVASAQPS